MSKTPDSVGNCESTETDYPPPVTEREVEQFLREYYAGKHPLPQAFKDALKKAEPEFKARLAAIYSEHRVPLISTATQTPTDSVRKQNPCALRKPKRRSKT